MIGKTVIVVPCYNEARRLNLQEFDRFCREVDDVALMFVDDGSTDRTWEMLEEFRARHPTRVSTSRSTCNLGKADAVRRGVLLALSQRPAYVGYWDADLATPLEAILQFRTVLVERPELMLVMGSRVALLGRQIRRHRTRHFLGRVFATAVSMALRLVVYDTQCGAKLFRATPETATLFEHPFRSRWIFDVEILARIIAHAQISNGVQVETAVYEFPLDRWEDVAGSQLKTQDFLIAVMDLAAIYWRYRRGGAAEVGRSEIRDTLLSEGCAGSKSAFSKMVGTHGLNHDIK